MASVITVQEEGNKKNTKKKADKEIAKALGENGTRKGRPWWSFPIQLTILVCLSGLLVAGIMTLKHSTFWGLEAWRGCLLIYLLSAGGILARWVTDVMVFSVGRLDSSGLIDRGKAHILVGLSKSGLGFIWVVMVLVAWAVVKVHWIKERPSKETIKALTYHDYITRALSGALVGVILWIGKTLFMEWLALYFIVQRSQQRIEETKKEQEDLKHIYDLVSSSEQGQSISSSSCSMSNLGEGQWLKDDQYNVWDWTPKYVVAEITKTKLPDLVGEKEEEVEEDINDIEERRSRAADELFDKIAEKCCSGGGTGSNKYIRKEKPETLPSEEALELMAKLEKVISPIRPLENEKEKRFRKSDFRRWVVKVYMNQRVLLHTVYGRDDVVGELNRIVSAIVLVIIFILWLLIMGLLTTKVMVLLATQIVALNFFFSDSAKTAFEATLFVFVTQPFDVGDLIKVEDGDQEMVVRDINMLGTVFKVTGGERVFSSDSAWMDKTNTKVFYPNSSLMRKHITNYYFVPDLSDTVEFNIAHETQKETIQKLETKVKEYLEKESMRWDKENYSFEEEDEEVYGNRKTKRVVLNVYHTLSNNDDESRRKDRNKLVSELRNYILKIGIELCES